MKRVQKTLLMLAVPAGAALAQSAPSSGVQVYGRADISINQISYAHGPHATTVTSDTSFIGFRGVEDLGAGLSAFFKMETLVMLNNGSAGGTLNLGNGANPPAPTPVSQFFNRESYVGLRHAEYGAISLGAHWSPAIWMTARVDPFQRSQLGSQTTLLQLPLTRGYAVQFVNSVQYASPSWGGFSAIVNGQLREQTFNRNWGALLQYANGPLYAGLTYDSVQANLFGRALGVSPDTRLNNLAIGAAYRFSFARLSAYWQQDTASGLPTVHGWMVGAAVPVGNGEVRASLAHTDIPGASARLGALGYNYFLSKRTQLYTTIARLDNHDGAKFALFPALLDGVTPSAGGQQGRGVQIGMRHTF